MQDRAICNLFSSPSAANTFTPSFLPPDIPGIQLDPGFSADADGIVTAVPCPTGTTGTDVPTGDCAPDAGYHGVTTATTIAPHWATDGVDGANVQLCTSQTGCATDTAMMCTTGLDLTQLQCTTMLPGYSSDADFIISAVACPADTTADPPGSNLATGNCIKNQGG